MTREPFSYLACAHYRNTYSVCAAGVDVATLVDVAGRVPCVAIRGTTGELACDKLAMPSTEEEKGPMRTMLDRLLQQECPKCGEMIGGEMEYGGNVVAMPCQHVIRSGT